MSGGIGGPGAQLHEQNLIKRALSDFSNYHAHGELYYPEATPGVIAVVTAGTYYSATGITEGLETDDALIVMDGAAGTITIGDEGAGLYRVDIGASFESARANVVLHAHVFLAGAIQQNIGFQRSIGTANVVGNASDWGHLLLAPDDVLSWRWTSDTNNTTITIDHGTFSLTWIAGEE